MKFATLLMVFSSVSATCAPPSAVDAAAYMKYTVQGMKDQITAAKQTLTGDEQAAKDAKTLLDTCHTTHHALTPV